MREESKAANLRDSMAAFLSCSEGVRERRDFLFFVFWGFEEIEVCCGGLILWDQGKSEMEGYIWRFDLYYEG